MTSALNSDALQATVTPGKTPVMVSEYMPGGRGVHVINTAVTGTVYLGTSSSVQSSNGVPVPAGSSVQWTASGQLWAVAGPDATGPMLVIASGQISSWAPSPEVIALAVAQQLLATGLPNVLTSQVIGDFVLPAAIDVHGYDSVLLIMTDTPVSQPVAVNYQFTDVANTALVQPGEWAQQGGAPIPLTLPVLGPTLLMQQAAADTNPVHTVRVIGTNRAAPRGHADALGYSPEGFESTYAGGLVSGTPVTVMFFNQPTKGTVFAGPANVEFVMQSTITPARFQIEWQTSEGLIDMDVCDTGETGWHAIGSSGGLSGITKQMPLPNTRMTIRMIPGVTTGGAVVTVRAYPAY